MSRNSREGTDPLYARLLGTSSAALELELGLQLAIGIWLSLGYVPTVAGAHASVAAMHGGGLDRILQGCHYWGSAIFILHSIVHLITMTWFGWFKPPYGLRYGAAIAVFLCSLGFQLSGNLLPFDRHGVQTATIEASIGARAPILGPTVSHLTLGGAEFGQATLDRWYLAHRILLPLLSLFAFGLSIWASRTKDEGSKADKRLVAVPALLVLLLGIAVASPFGSAAGPADYEAFAARSSWYVWPLHGTMRLFDSMATGLGWVGSLLLPGLFVLFLVLLPLSRGKISVVTARGVLGAFLALFGACALLFGGQPASLTGTRDPVVETGGKTADPGKKPDAIDQALVEKGKAIFNKMECADCHGKDGAQAGGGPALTRVWQRHPDAGYFIRYIQKPTAVKADSTMPAFPSVPKDDLKAIAEFLRSPKK